MARKRMLRFLFTPAFFAAWPVGVSAALLLAYRVDPYVFGIMTLVLAGASMGVAVAGGGMVWLSRTATWRLRVGILLSLAATAAVIGIALHALGRFSWA